MALQSSNTARDRIHTQAGTGNRPGGSNGMVRVNSSNKCLEYHNGTSWQCATKPVEAGNGAINMNAGTGLKIVSGSQGTANASSDCLRSIAVNRAVTDTWYTGTNLVGDSEVFILLVYYANYSSIRAQYNVRSVERLSGGGGGNFRVTLSNQAPNNRYVLAGNNTNAGLLIPLNGNITRTYFDFRARGHDGDAANSSGIHIMGVNIN